MSFPYLTETQELNQETRRAAPGLFAPLPDGMTHYRLAGPPDGPPVVLVHGFSVASFIFDSTSNALAEAGFRVLRYDLFGRGFSDRPRMDYTLDLFTRQLCDLLDALRFPSPFNLLGLSMGAPITAAFTNRRPGRVHRHILVDPASVRRVELGWLKAARLPIFGELALGLFGGENMVKGIASDFFKIDTFQKNIVDELTRQYRIQMRYNGFKRAILSTLRNGILDDQSDLYHRVGALRKPTLALWGRNDPTIPFEHSEQLLACMPHTRLVTVENCGHVPLLERPEVTFPTLVEFLHS